MGTDTEATRAKRNITAAAHEDISLSAKGNKFKPKFE